LQPDYAHKIFGCRSYVFRENPGELFLTQTRNIRKCLDICLRELVDMVYHFR
jgi:hypothetical protein